VIPGPPLEGKGGGKKWMKEWGEGKA